MSDSGKVSPASWWALGVVYAALIGLVVYDPLPFQYLLAIVWPN
jgi:hypothetical protein